MINFFRKIRKTLVSENRFTRYLIYAIGEIVLVMLGILIAVQVNDWNNRRQFERTNLELLQKLANELDLNMERLHFLDKTINSDGVPRGLETLSFNCDTALTYIMEGLDSTKAVWILQTPAFMASSLNLHSSIYEEMKNTGRLYSVGNDSLISSIDKYYRRIEREEFYNNKRNEYAMNSFRACNYGWTNLRMDYSGLGAAAFKDHPWMFDRRSSEYIDMKIAFTNANSALYGNRMRMLEIIDDSEQLQAEILSEIQQRSR